ncbi:Alpha/Beta hydrolase protein [Aspergillus pseudoustus]|uniref:Alpha/Beta hydrolase protein n=1 Tax=Aspergillus pseudoustus TaxID=1810923 RepID=A0ABR4JV52_9EURO
MSTDLFPGFTTHHIPTPCAATIFTRVSPATDKPKPPLLLIHGFPQTHIEWHKLAPLLIDNFTLILVDLRGYGASSLAHKSTNGSGYTKRMMAQDCIAVMDAVGYERKKFHVVGHDRGARVAYRLAYDFPERVDKLVVVDIVPTASMFRSFNEASMALKAYHWLFLAQPAPVPEQMIMGVDGGRAFLERSLASWSGSKTLDAFAAEKGVLDRYREAYCNEERIHATCEDYRAGAYFDRVNDEDELESGRKLELPILAVWGLHGTPAGGDKSPIDLWSQYASDVRGTGIDCGHFIPEEEPEKLAKEILPFLL